MPKAGTKATPEQVAELLKGLANPTRLRIVDLLSKHHELSAGAIQERIEVSQSLTSHNLTKMTDKGILIRTSWSTENYYSLSDPLFAELLTLVLKTRC